MSKTLVYISSNHSKYYQNKYYRIKISCNFYFYFFSSLKLVYIFSVNPYLGPLQVSLSRMVLDIMKFFFLYILVLFAFSCGLNQLLWYYADMEKKKCVIEPDVSKNGTKNSPSSDRTACLVWRRFSKYCFILILEKHFLFKFSVKIYFKLLVSACLKQFRHCFGQCLV